MTAIETRTRAQEEALNSHSSASVVYCLIIEYTFRLILDASRSTEYENWPGTRFNAIIAGSLNAAGRFGEATKFKAQEETYKSVENNKRAQDISVE